jgi:nucleoside-diphosphate-sugar epimerase
MRVLITGGAGFLGSYIANALEGHDVAVYDKAQSKSHKTIVGSVLDIELMKKSFGGFDAIIHAAAITSTIGGANEEIFQVNSAGTFNVHEAARANGIAKVISTSSESVYGYFMQNVDIRHAPKRLPLDEERLTNPRDAYSLSKVMGEGIAKFYGSCYGMNTAVIRPPWIVAPKDYECHLGFKNGGKSGWGRGQSAFPFNYFNTHAWVDVRDLADAYKIVLEKNSKFEIYNCCSDDSTLNVPLSVIYKGYECFEGFDDMRSGMSNDKIKSLGFSPFFNRSHLV